MKIEGINSFRTGDELETDNEVTGQLEFETVSVNVPSGDDLLIGQEEERSGLGESGLTNGLKNEGINSFRTGDELETDNEDTGQLEFDPISVNVSSGEGLLVGLEEERSGMGESRLTNGLKNETTIYCNVSV